MPKNPSCLFHNKISNYHSDCCFPCFLSFLGFAFDKEKAASTLAFSIHTHFRQHSIHKEMDEHAPIVYDLTEYKEITRDWNDDPSAYLTRYYTKQYFLSTGP